MLNHGRDARQVLVWGVTKDGQRFDLTDDATFKSESAAVTIGADRYINPADAGRRDGHRHARRARQAQLPVKVVERRPAAGGVHRAT